MANSKQIEVLEAFHDSELIAIEIDKDLLKGAAVLETSDLAQGTRRLRIRFEGILAFEFETLGGGEGNKHGAPVPIYDVYVDWLSPESQRWKDRLAIIAPHAASSVVHITLASSFNRGWGRNANLEGISVVCRKYWVEEVRDDELLD